MQKSDNVRRVTLDFETKSAADLRKVGAWKYSEHETTEVLCLALKWEGNSPHSLTPDQVRPNSLQGVLAEVDEIWAHNSEFEVAIWQNVCVKKYGWPELPLEKIRCSAAVAAMHSLPRSLDGVGKALGLPIVKDKRGGYLIGKLSKPKPVNLSDLADNPGWEAGPKKRYMVHSVTGEIQYLWNEDPEDLAEMYRYCEQDCCAEEAVLHALRPLPPGELAIWQLDQKINRKGIKIDVPAVEAMVAFIAEHEGNLNQRLRDLTFGTVSTGKQTAAMLEYLKCCGVVMHDLQADTVAVALEDELPAVAREILEIRQSLARSAGAKYQTMLDTVCADGRIRGTLLYHGASTGRWSGMKVQPQNMPSRIKITAPAEEMLAVIVAGGLTLFQMLYPDDPLAAAGAIIRSVITAEEGHDLVVADYSAVEGRGLAWLSGDEPELEVYRSGKDPYIATAARILHKRYEDITPEERSQPGKVATLFCGFGGSVGAVRKAKQCKDLTDDEIKEQIITPWREAHPMAVAFWRDLEKAAVAAVREPGTVQYARSIAFNSCPDNFLKCRLPSGRLLYYYDPRIEPTETSWGEVKDALTYMTVNSQTRQWSRTSTYAGKLCENVDQAICRDLLAQAMLRLDAAGYQLTMSVHDEPVSEVPEGFGSVEEYERIMCEVPAWATGFPIAAAGWRGKRYKK